MTVASGGCIHRIASRQHGVVTRRQLLDAGLSAPSVQRRVGSGALRPRHRGVYRVGPVESPQGWAMAAVLACGHRAVISHMSGLALRHLWGERGSHDPSPVDLTVESFQRGPRRPGIRVHRPSRGLPDDECDQVEGIPVTSVPRTILDAASQLDIRTLESVIARAERKTDLTADQLSRFVRQHPGYHGVPMVRVVLGLGNAPALTRSEAESRFLQLVRSAGLPNPGSNVQVGRYEVDFLWPSRKLVVEVDGFQYHASRARFENDRPKDAWLQRRGLRVIRLTWTQIVHDSVATIVTVGRALGLP